MSIRFTRQENGGYIRTGELPEGTRRVGINYDGCGGGGVYTPAEAEKLFEGFETGLKMRKEWYEIVPINDSPMAEETKARLRDITAQKREAKKQEKAKLAAEEADAAASLPGAVPCAPVEGTVSKSVERRVKIQKAKTPRADKPKPPKRQAKVLDPSDPGLTPVQKWRIKNAAAIAAAAAEGITLGEWRKKHPEAK